MVKSCLRSLWMVPKAIDVAQTAGPMLVEVGRHNAAAQLYMGVEMIKEAVDAFISAQEWGKSYKEK